MKVYIIGELPFEKIKAEQILEVIKNAPEHKVLWFGPYNKKEKEQFSESLPGLEYHHTFADFENISLLIKEIEDSGIFYFSKQEELSEYRAFLKKNDIKEDSFYLTGLEKYPLDIIILKKKNKYYKLLTVQRGYDDSLHFVIDGKYEKSSSLTDSNNFSSPYICYQRTGVVHSKDYRGNYFIPTTKINNTGEIFAKNEVFTFFTLISHLNLSNLKETSIMPLDLKPFNCIEIGQSLSNTNKKDILKKETFIIIDIDIMEENEDLYLEFLLHNNDVKDSLLDQLEEYQKAGIFNHLTMENNFSRLCYTVLFKKTNFRGADHFDGLIISLVGKRNFYVCSLNKVI